VAAPEIPGAECFLKNAAIKLNVLWFLPHLMKKSGRFVNRRGINIYFEEILGSS